MKYYIHFSCRAGSRTAYRVNEDIFEKLIDTIKDCDDLYGISDLWYSYKEDGDHQDEYEQCYRWRCYYVGDRVDWYVTDENGKEVYASDTDCFELREMPNINEEKQPQYEDGLWFERSSTFKGAGWIFSLELDNEEFDPDKLYFKKANYIDEDLNELKYIDALCYEGGEVMCEDEAEDAYFEEQYWQESLIAVVGKKVAEIDFNVEDLEKVKSLVTFDSDGKTEDEMQKILEDCSIFKKEEKSSDGDEETSVGKEELQVAYQDCSDFREGMARVKKNGKWGLIDKTGEVIMPVEYDKIWDFNEGLAQVWKNDKRGYINKTGKVVIPIEYDYVTSFDDGLVSVRKNDKWGFLDMTGKVVVPIEYDEVRLSDGLIELRNKSKWHVIDKTGKTIIPTGYSYMEVRDGLIYVRIKDKVGVLDLTGKVIVPSEFDEVHFFSEGLAAIKKNDKWGFLDKTCTIVIPLEYDEANSFSEGLAWVKKNGGWGVIDKTGKVVVPCE